MIDKKGIKKLFFHIGYTKTTTTTTTTTTSTSTSTSF